ncbi:hypothetical protein SAMN05421819_2911 [Bryocella elongata]|uniref:Uncharacterized protein n=1 Tax=Bryocella elongata TaxID=863522 RepID=A0A1H6A4M6_9BACT|nr:hypothetical protein [Bryocella elongata]SEG43391.1 hypothetical protein SAMN05421819_2911 [Bryocella elongata]
MKLSPSALAALLIATPAMACTSDCPMMKSLHPGTPCEPISAAAAPSMATAPATPPMVMQARNLIEAQLQHGSSGTSIEPASTPVSMLMTSGHGWQLMLHGTAFVANNQQQAAKVPGQAERGRDAFFSTNWVMPMAEHRVGPGTLTLRTMLSLEPGTVHNREYPELFQQGETAYGTPILDGQHPHDLWMELAAIYDVPLGKRALFELYSAPVGDPAIGPTAYPHRASAGEDPLAALGHHQEDSTHIAFNVITGGLTYRWARVELSGFHGGEPAEDRWHFQPSTNGHNVDSVSTRLTVSPTADWTGQYSFAHIQHPEALYPTEDQQRQTASIMYHHTWKHAASDNAMGSMDMSGDMAGMDMAAMDMKHSAAMPGMSAEPSTDLSATFVWGRTKAEPLAPTSASEVANSYLAEARFKFLTKNYVWTRLENAARTSELELTPGAPLPIGFDEQGVGHVAAYSFGYDRDFAAGPHLVIAPGTQISFYRTPDALRSIYGNTPTGEAFFLRLRLR